MIPRPLLALAAFMAVPLHAAPSDDPRILALDYNAGGIFHVSTTPEASQTVLFAPGERVQSVVVSDPGAYQISVTGTGDGITLKANGMSALALVNVRTDRRAYELQLVPGSAYSAPSVVRFSYAPPFRPFGPPPMSTRQAPGFAWRVSGDKTMRPASIRDDGTKIYIEWHREQAQPAVFALGASGREEIVEGYVRAGVLTIDRLPRELVFRIDKIAAKAQRVQEKVRRGRK